MECHASEIRFLVFNARWYSCAIFGGIIFVITSTFCATLKDPLAYSMRELYQYVDAYQCQTPE